MAVVINPGGPTDRESIKLATRKRRFIRNLAHIEALPETMRARIEVNTKAHPSIEPISGSAVYNCYGMVFAARRTWILHPEDVSAILEDDGYHPLPWDPAAWQVGDIVLYNDRDGGLTHVGMIARKSISISDAQIKVDVLSTWGETGEYLHPIDVVSPFLGKPSAVVSQRFLP